jgi:hypothetical protein
MSNTKPAWEPLNLFDATGPEVGDFIDEVVTEAGETISAAALKAISDGIMFSMVHSILQGPGETCPCGEQCVTVDE